MIFVEILTVTAGAMGLAAIAFTYGYSLGEQDERDKTRELKWAEYFGGHTHVSEDSGATCRYQVVRRGVPSFKALCVIAGDSLSLVELGSGTLEETKQLCHDHAVRTGYWDHPGGDG